MMRLSLFCPRSKERIKTPIKWPDFPHLQCLDKDYWIALWSRTALRARVNIRGPNVLFESATQSLWDSFGWLVKADPATDRRKCQ